MRPVHSLAIPHLLFAVLGLLCLFLPSAALAQAADQLEFPTFGVSVRLPSDLQEIPVGSIGQVVRFAKVDATGHVIGVVVCEVEPANGRTLDQWAAGTAKRIGGLVAPNKSTIGGIAAIHVTSATNPPSLHPSEAYAALRGKYIWVISCFSSAQWSDPQSVDRVRDGIRFTKPVTPTQTATFYHDPKTIFSDISINVPIFLRPLTPENPKTQIQLGAWDYVNDTDTFSIVLEDARLAADLKQDGGLFGWAEALGRKHQLAKPPRWKRIGADGTKAITEPFTSALAPKTSMLCGIAQVAPSRVIVITATISTDPHIDAKAYQDILDRIVGSISAKPC